MGKEVKTNAMRILDKNKIPYEIINYECDEFIDGLHTAEATGAPVEQSFKTLVMQGKSKQYYVFVLPIAEEVDLKVAAKTVGEKSVEMIHVKDITAITGFLPFFMTAPEILTKSISAAGVSEPPLPSIRMHCSP